MQPTTTETLENAAIRFENERHAERLREIQCMSARLAELERYIPVLKDSSVSIDAKQITLHLENGLHILPGYFNRLSAKAALAALLDQGFSEVKRSDHLSYVQIVISNGSLQILLTIDKTVIDIGPPAKFSNPLDPLQAD